MRLVFWNATCCSLFPFFLYFSLAYTSGILHINPYCRPLSTSPPLSMLFVCNFCFKAAVYLPTQKILIIDIHFRRHFQYLFIWLGGCSRKMNEHGEQDAWENHTNTIRLIHFSFVWEAI